MTIDDYIDPDCSCLDPDHIISRSRIERGLYWNPKEYERHRARILSKPLPAIKLKDKIKFYLSEDTIRLKYNLAMWFLEEKTPTIYKALLSIGLPEPY